LLRYIQKFADLGERGLAGHAAADAGEGEENCGSVMESWRRVRGDGRAVN
jgi:hypothetical protein